MNKKNPEERNDQRCAPHTVIRLGPAFGIFILLMAGQGWAHGVRGVIDTRQAACILAEYDGGDPMSYGSVEIIAPDSKLLFQSGRTDRNGWFCFLPDIPGDWQLDTSDAMGHKLRLTSTVDENMIPSAGDETGINSGGLGVRSIRIVDGLAVIFGSAGILAWWRSRKRC